MDTDRYHYEGIQLAQKMTGKGWMTAGTTCCPGEYENKNARIFAQ